MKKIFSICILLLFAVQVYSQNSPVTFGTEEQTKNLSGSTNIIIGKDGDNFYVLRMEGINAQDAQLALMQDNPGGTLMAMVIGTGVIDDDHRLFDVESFMGSKGGMFAKLKLYLQKYDINCQQVWSKEFTLKLNDKELRLKSLFFLNGTLTLFATQFDKDSYKTSLYYTTFNNDGILDTKYTKVSEVLGKNSAFTNAANSYRVIPSPDNSTVLVYFHQNNEKGSSPQKIGLGLYDNSMKQLWSKSYTPSFGEDKFAIVNHIIGKDGSVYLIAKVASSSEEKKEGKKGFSYDLLKAGPDITALKKIEIQIPNKLVTDIYTDELSDGTMKIFGFYSEKSEKKAGGAYVYTIGKDFSIEKKANKDFTTEVITSILGDDKEAEKKSELGNIHARKVFPNSDGTYTIVAENYIIFTSSSNYGMEFGYHYYDISLFKIKDDATIDWSTVVHKKQKSTNDAATMLSFSCQFVNDNIYIVFNGGKKEMGKMMWNHDNAVVYLAKVNPDGKVDASPLFSTKEVDKTVVPKTSYLLSDNQIVLFTVHGLKYEFARVDLK